MDYLVLLDFKTLISVSDRPAHICERMRMHVTCSITALGFRKSRGTFFSHPLVRYDYTVKRI